MRASAKVTKGALELLEKHIKPGVTTAQLDKIAYDFIISQGAKPNFLNYNGFPGTICASINDEVVHGIPSKTDGTVMPQEHSESERFRTRHKIL